MTGFGQCSSHFLDLKGSQTTEEGFVQKGNNRHAGPLPLCLGAVCGCMANVFVAYSPAKIHIAGESRKGQAKSGRGTTAITQNLPRNRNTSISIPDFDEMAALAISRMDYCCKTSFNGLLTSFTSPAHHRAARVH